MVLHFTTCLLLAELFQSRGILCPVFDTQSCAGRRNKSTKRPLMATFKNYKTSERFVARTLQSASGEKASYRQSIIVLEQS